MRKYIIGAIFGALLTMTVGAHAEVINMIGKTIDGSFPIKIGGKTLNNPAITIEGTSYVPTREFAESLGATVKFDANLGIEVIPQTTTTAKTTPTTEENPLVKTYNELGDKLDKLVVDKQSLEKQINDIHTKNALNGKADGDDIKELQQQVDAKQAEIDQIMNQRKSLEDQMKAAAQSQP
jgi:hypothetical protein